MLIIFATAIAFNASATEEIKKGKKGDKASDKTEQSDSLIIDSEVDAPDVEDTLVYEDWDIGNGDDIGNLQSNKVMYNGGATDKKEQPNDNFGEMMLERVNNLLQHEYTVDFAVYPNPTVETLHITTQNFANEIRVLNSSGQPVMQSGFVPNLQVGHLPAGTYIVQLWYDDHVESRRFIKN